MKAEPFSRRAVLLIASVGAASLVAAIVVLVAGGTAAPASSAPDSFSRSALGHHAFVALLRELGMPVLVSRWSSGERSATGLLILAEPRLEDDHGRHLAGMLERAGPTLVVLPKRTGSADGDRPGWLARSRLVPEAASLAPLLALGTSGAIERGARDRLPLALDRNPYGYAPTLAQPQLVRSGALEPVISSGGGVLLGRVPGAGDAAPRYVLSDPDLLATHSLGDGENAALIVAIVRDLIPAGGTVVVDETLHGHAQPPSLWAALTRFPLVLIVLQLGLVSVAAVWAGQGRFGAALPEPAALAQGKRALIENTAELLRFGGHWRLALQRYSTLLIGDVARRMHAPPKLEGAALVPWLKRMSVVRGASLDVAAALAEAERAERPEQALRIAAALAAWRKEILHGFDGDRRAH